MSEQTVYTPHKTEQKADVLYSLRSVFAALAISVVTGIMVYALVSVVLGGWMHASKAAQITALLSTVSVWAIDIRKRWVSIGEAFLHWGETISGEDINNDKYIGKPPEPTHHKFTVSSENGYVSNDYEIAATYEQIVEMARRTIEGVSFSEGNYIKGSNKLFTPTEFKRVKGQLLLRGLLEKEDDRLNSALRWTDAGFELMSEIAVNAR